MVDELEPGVPVNLVRLVRLCAEKHLFGSDQQTLSAVKQMRFDSEMRKAADL